MYAIIQSGGRQIRVEPGAVVNVDHRPEAEGDPISFDEVLFVGSDDGGYVSGSPHVTGTRVTGVVAGEEKGTKVRVFIKKRRKGMRRTLGHRTRWTQVRITGIESGPQGDGGSGK